MPLQSQLLPGVCSFCELDLCRELRKMKISVIPLGHSNVAAHGIFRNTGAVKEVASSCSVFDTQLAEYPAPTFRPEPSKPLQKDPHTAA